MNPEVVEELTAGRNLETWLYWLNLVLTLKMESCMCSFLFRSMSLWQGPALYLGAAEFCCGLCCEQGGMSSAGWQQPSGSTHCRMFDTGCSQLRKESLLHMIFLITCMENPFVSVRIYTLNECRGSNRNMKGRCKCRRLLKHCNASFPDVQESYWRI